MSSFRVKTVSDSQSWNGLHQDRLDCLPSSSYIEEVRAHERHIKVETVGIVPQIRSDTRGFVCKESANLEYYDAYTIDHRRVIWRRRVLSDPFSKVLFLLEFPCPLIKMRFFYFALITTRVSWFDHTVLIIVVRADFYLPFSLVTRTSLWASYCIFTRGASRNLCAHACLDSRPMYLILSVCDPHRSRK